MAALSDGAFDPCIGEHLERWGYLPPTATARGPSRAPAGTWRGRAADRPRPRAFRAAPAPGPRGHRQGLRGGLRRAGAAMRRESRRSWSTPGGDLRIAGPWEQRVRLRHPQAPHLGAELLTLRNAALATSAAYYSRRRLAIGRGLGAARSTPVRGPTSGTSSVSVRAADCMSADALTKVVLFAPPKLRRARPRRLQRAGLRAHARCGSPVSSARRESRRPALRRGARGAYRA